MSIETRATTTENGGLWLFVFQNTEKGGEGMSKGNSGYATNKGGVIKAPKPTSGEPKATVTKGDDLRVGKK